MNRAITFWYIFVSSYFLFPISTSYAQNGWGPDMRLTYRQGYSYDPKAACCGDTVHLVWWESYAHEEVFYKRSTDAGETWGPDVRLTPEDNITAALPCVAVSGNNVHVVWEEQGLYYYAICYTRSEDGGETWGCIDTITQDSWYHPWICAIGTYVYVVAIKSGGGGLVFVKSTDMGNTWLPYQAITSAVDRPRIVNLPGDSLFLAIVYCNSPREIWNVTSLDGGATWSDSQVVSHNDSIVSQSSAAAISDNGDIHVCWEDGKYSPYPWTGDILYRASRDSGTTWQPIDSLTVMHRAVYSDILAERNNLHLVWDDDRHDFGDNFEIYYRTSSDLGQTWGSEMRLTNAINWSCEPSLACGGNYLHLFWTDLRDDSSNIVGEIYYKRKDLSWGVSEIEKVSVSSQIKVEVYPNPFSQELRIRYTMHDTGYIMKDMSIKLFDVSGKEVMGNSIEPESESFAIDTRDLVAGVYFVQVAVDGVREVKKVIKVK